MNGQSRTINSIKNILTNIKSLIKFIITNYYLGLIESYKNILNLLY